MHQIIVLSPFVGEIEFDFISHTIHYLKVDVSDLSSKLQGSSKVVICMFVDLNDAKEGCHWAPISTVIQSFWFALK